MIVRFKLSGEATEILARMARFPAALDAAKDRVTLAAAQDVVKAVKEAITGQVFPMAALSPRYAKRKAYRGHDPRTLIATKEYLESIATEYGDDGWGVMADEERMKLLEYGTKKMPGRPHWAPAIAGASFTATKKLAKEIINALSRG